MRERGAGAFFYKVRRVGPSLAADASLALARAIATAADHFSDPSDYHPFGDAGHTIAILLTRVNERERFTVACDLLTSTPSIGLGYEILLWTCPADREKDEQRLFTSGQESRIGRLVADRIARLPLSPPFYIAAERNTPWMLYAWSTYGDKRKLRTYLNRTFAEDPTHAIHLMKTYLPITNDDPSIRDWRDLTADRYASIAAVADTEAMYRALRRKYGPALDRPPSRDDWELPSDEGFARQFAQLHRSAKTSADADRLDRQA
jgi:hypothetical protein